jgi:antiphage defense system Thoeris ThsB-like protein
MQIMPATMMARAHYSLLSEVLTMSIVASCLHLLRDEVALLETDPYHSKSMRVILALLNRYYRRSDMARKNRIFISFAIEDEWARDLLVGQAKNNASPFSFVDMSVKKPWDEKWRTNCRTKIKGCDGMLALVSKNTANAEGALWEVACAKEEAIPVRGVYTNADNRPSSVPTEFSEVRVVSWTWDNIANWLATL